MVLCGTLLEVYVRGHYISLIAAIHTEQASEASAVQGEVDDGVMSHAHSHTPVDFVGLEEALRELQLHMVGGN